MKLTVGKAILALVIIAVLAVLVLTLIDYGYPMWRSSQGYCVKDGRKLAPAERLDFALEDYLRNQELFDLEEIGMFERKDRTLPSIEDVKRDFTVIPYASREEFLQANPQCCQLTWSLPEGERIGFWEKADDSGDGYFYFAHKIRYLDRQGTRKEITATRTYYQVMNCGHVRHHFYY